MATLVSVAVTQPSTGQYPVVADTRYRPVGRREALDWHTIKARLKADHMVRNSLYLILSSGIQAAIGFAFWIITTRLFGAADVGRAGSLIAAAGLIGLVCMLGLNNTFIRYLPSASNWDAMLTAGLLLTAVCGIVISIGYVAMTPIVAPRLAFLAHNPLLGLGFALLTACAAINVLTDCVFISARKAGYSALADAGFGSTTKILAGLALVGTGAFGLFSASVGGVAVAAIASIVLMITALRWRPKFQGGFSALKPLLGFSAANYVSNVLDLAPGTLVALIVLDRLGPVAAAYYYVAFQVSMLLSTVINALGQAILAEGSQIGADWAQVLKRSAMLLTVVCVPASLVLAVGGHWILLVFGHTYSQHGTGSLAMLAVSALPSAACCWLWTVLRLFGKLGTIVWASVVYTIAVCGLAWVLAPRGLTVLTSAWLIGGVVSMIVAAAPVAAVLMRQSRSASEPEGFRAAGSQGTHQAPRRNHAGQPGAWKAPQTEVGAAAERYSATGPIAVSINRQRASRQ